MQQETNKNYTPEQFWKLYKKLPQELKDALFDNEVGNDIYEVCEKNNVLEYHKQILILVSRVLLGVLPPEELENAFKTELKLKEKQVKKITQEIHRFVFYPVKETLGEFYSTEILPKNKEEKMSTPKETEKESAPKGPDTYREPIE